MSVNQIDVNAVNARTAKEAKKFSTPPTTPELDTEPEKSKIEDEVSN